MAYCAWCLKKASDCRCPPGPSEIPGWLGQRVRKAMLAVEEIVLAPIERPDKFEGFASRLNTAPPRPTVPSRPAERMGRSTLGPKPAAPQGSERGCCWKNFIFPHHRCRENR